MVPVTRLVERKRDQIEAVIRAEERRCCCAGKRGGIEVTAIAQPMWKADANKTAAWMLLTTGPACQQKPRGFSLLYAHYLSISAGASPTGEMPPQANNAALYTIYNAAACGVFSCWLLAPCVVPQMTTKAANLA